MQTQDKYTLATAIYKYVINARSLDSGIKFAILFMVMVPPIFVFLVFQKFIIRASVSRLLKGRQRVHHRSPAHDRHMNAHRP